MAEGRWSGPARHRARRGQDRAPLALGWGVRDAATRGATVVAAFDRERLGEGLARLHGQGFGPAARVLDGTRGDLAGQLARSGLPAEVAGRLVPAEDQKRTSLLIVNAPGRSAAVAELLGRSGARVVEVLMPQPDPEKTSGPVPEVAGDAGIAEAAV